MEHGQMRPLRALSGSRRKWATSKERRGQHPGCVQPSCPQPLPAPPHLQNEVCRGRRASGGGEGGRYRQLLPPLTLSFLSLLDPSWLLKGQTPTPASLGPVLLYPQSTPLLGDWEANSIHFMPVHPQPPFCLQLRRLWRQGTWSEGGARVKAWGPLRPLLGPSPTALLLTLLFSGQGPSPAGCASHLLYIPSSSGQEGGWAGAGAGTREALVPSLLLHPLS